MTASSRDRHVVLVGMMGSGKTTTGRAVAGRLTRPMRDCDADLEARVGSSGAQIAARRGVDELHELEEEILVDALAAEEPTVITAAGWVVESRRCRDAMAEKAFVVWLDLPVEDLLRRMAASDHRRPIAGDAAVALLERRHLLYTELADLRLDAREPTDELVASIVAAVRRTNPVRSPVPDDARLQELVDRLDLPTKVRLMAGANFWAMHGIPEIGLRPLVVADGPSGVRGFTWDERDPSASLPSATAVAATWDESLLGRVAEVLASEARRKGVDVVLGPTINLHRSPRAGRHFEYLSEDPLLSGRLGAAYVRALQEWGVGATPKHYVANDSETDRFTLDAQVDEQTLREVYLAPFEHLVSEAQPWMVMAAYNAVNGHTMTENDLLAEPLKGEWGFDGAVVSDWFATRSVEAAGPGLTDLAMPGPDGPWGAALVAAVEDGRVPEAAIDDHALRLLRLAARVGALEGFGAEVPVAAAADALHLDDREVAAVAREVAADGMVLVRNEGGVLPLAATSLRSVAVIGANAIDARIQGGGSAGVVPPYAVSPVQGLTAALGDGATVTHALGAKLLDGLATLDERLTVNPATGDPGLHVRWFGDDDAEIASEERFRGRLRWKETIPSGARGVEISTRVVADADGSWRFGITGVGRYAVDLDGETVFDGELEPQSDAFDAAVHEPGEFAAERQLATGDEVLLAVRIPVDEGAFGVNVTIGAERPVAAPDVLIAEAVTAAREADVAIVVVGTTSEVESEGFDRDSLALPGRQDALVHAVAATGTPTVVVVNSGSPVLTPWRDEVAAVLLSWFGGQEYGNALADVLLGGREPGGRLPTTWGAREEDVPVLDTTPTEGHLAYAEGVHVGYRAWARAEASPAFPFGSGQGYTTWELGPLTVVDDLSSGSGAFRASVRVANTGDRAGKHVVQAYLSRSVTEVERPALWLAGFAVVRAQAGETALAELVIDRRAFEHWSPEASAWQLEPGMFELSVGTSVEDRPLTTEVAG